MTSILARYMKLLYFETPQATAGRARNITQNARPQHGVHVVQEGEGKQDPERILLTFTEQKGDDCLLKLRQLRTRPLRCRGQTVVTAAGAVPRIP